MCSGSASGCPSVRLCRDISLRSGEISTKLTTDILLGVWELLKSK